MSFLLISLNTLILNIGIECGYIEFPLYLQQMIGLDFPLPFCFSNYSPAVQKIQHDCAKEYHAYDQCLKDNPQEVTKCVQQLHDFMNCAEKCASRIQNAVIEKS